jgi:hypothetical protein
LHIKISFHRGPPKKTSTKKKQDSTKSHCAENNTQGKKRFSTKDYFDIFHRSLSAPLFCPHESIAIMMLMSLVGMARSAREMVELEGISSCLFGYLTEVSVFHS